MSVLATTARAAAVAISALLSPSAQAGDAPLPAPSLAATDKALAEFGESWFLRGGIAGARSDEPDAVSIARAAQLRAYRLQEWFRSGASVASVSRAPCGDTEGANALPALSAACGSNAFSQDRPDQPGDAQKSERVLTIVRGEAGAGPPQEPAARYANWLAALRLQ